ncbi:unnamed protein product [Didymodactylos carnosus]|uniref:Uncharacterized protein n=1 Tax=Didymodactylos carnosus TaxID=1234261 RepID=A0A8S2DB65_9BILA|nr:unnamed protein product [Didymodactylos carnosus]CAF3675190.1 unnamed protein product [Didymodactylos carnosus]
MGKGPSKGYGKPPWLAGHAPKPILSVSKRISVEWYRYSVVFVSTRKGSRTVSGIGWYSTVFCCTLWNLRWLPARQFSGLSRSSSMAMICYITTIILVLAITHLPQIKTSKLNLAVYDVNSASIHPGTRDKRELPSANQRSVCGETTSPLCTAFETGTRLAS